MLGGEFSRDVAAVTAGGAARHSRFGIVNSLYYDKRRGRIRSKQAGRGGTGTVMRAKGLSAIVVRSSLPRANGNNAVDPAGVRRVQAVGDVDGPTHHQAQHGFLGEAGAAQDGADPAEIDPLSGNAVLSGVPVEIEPRGR